MTQLPMRVQMRVCLIAVQRSASAAAATPHSASSATITPAARTAATITSSARMAAAAAQSTPLSLSSSIVWFVQPPPPPVAPSAAAAAAPALSPSDAAVAATISSAVTRAAPFAPSPSDQPQPLDRCPQQRQRRRRISAAPQPFYSGAVSTVTAKARTALDDGQAWLAAGAVGTWRHRAYVAFVALQRRIDAREEALGLVRAFLQRAEEDERKVERAGEEAPRADQADQATASAAGAAQPSAAPVAAAPSSFVLTLLHPSTVPAAAVRSYLHAFLSDRRRFHSRRIWSLMALLPPTAALCILPGPNPFLVLWAFRAMGHWQAREGAAQLQQMLRELEEEEEEEDENERQAEAQAGLLTAPEGAADSSALSPAAASAGQSPSASDLSVATPPVQLELVSYDAESEGGAASPSLSRVCSQLELDEKAVETIIARWKND